MSALTVAEVLDGAANLLEKPGAWTQSTFASDAVGNPVSPTSQDAVCFCAVGAVASILSMPGYEAEDWLKTSSGLHGLRVIALEEFNDDIDRKYTEVVAKLRQAAAFARETAA